MSDTMCEQPGCDRPANLEVLRLERDGARLCWPCALQDAYGCGVIRASEILVELLGDRPEVRETAEILRDVGGAQRMKLGNPGGRQ